MDHETHWEQNRERIRHEYARHDPTETELYRLAYHHYEELERVWDERFEYEYGRFRPELRKAFEEYLACGCFVNGAAFLVCQEPGCAHSRVLSFSCKVRLLCPSCSAKRAVLFAEHLVQEVLKPVDHRHVGFSIPKCLRWAFKRVRSRLNMLFESAEETLRELLVEACGEGKIGLMLTAQTAGQNLRWNPHLHGISACGVFQDNEVFVPLRYINPEKATRLFAHKVLARMQQAGLITESLAEKLLSWRHSGFSVWFGEPIPYDDKAALHFVAQYIDRGPVEKKRLTVVDDLVSYEAEAENWEGDALSFLARLTSHLPSKYESVLRFYGRYSHRARGEEAKQLAATIEASQLITLPEPHSRIVSKRWSSLIKRVFEIDALKCDRCGGRMKIKSFITDPQQVARVLRHRGIPQYRAPPPLPPQVLTLVA